MNNAVTCIVTIAVRQRPTSEKVDAGFVAVASDRIR